MAFGLLRSLSLFVRALVAGVPISSEMSARRSVDDARKFFIVSQFT